jgi:DNA polymerase
LPYLEQQILLIKPKVIVTLGRFAMNLFFPNAKISEVHGQILEKDSRKIVALYHPAAALYNGGMRETLKQDFQILKKFI